MPPYHILVINPGSTSTKVAVYEDERPLCVSTIRHQPDELAAFHRVKAAFDPPGLLNPDKAVPTLHRCAELGRMHVHRGELKFPELERF